MSRDETWPEASSAQVAAQALERIADTLDDYMTMSLAAQEVFTAARGTDPDLVRAVQPLIDVLAAIRKERASR